MTMQLGKSLAFGNQKLTSENMTKHLNTETNKIIDTYKLYYTSPACIHSNMFYVQTNSIHTYNVTA